MASPPPNQDQFLIPDQTHLQHIVRVQQSLADLIERGVRGEDSYVNAEGLLAARETEEDEDIIEQLHLHTRTLPGCKPLPWERREIQDPDLKYIDWTACAELTNILESVELLVQKPFLIKKLAAMLEQPRRIIQRDLKKVFEEHLMLPLSCWSLLNDTTDYHNLSAAQSKGQYIWENVLGPARILLGVTRTVRPLPPIEGRNWRLLFLQALAELHRATRPADRSLQNALNMLDEVCPASALTNGLSDHQKNLLWHEVCPWLLKNLHLTWPIRLVDFAEEHLGIDPDDFHVAFAADHKDVVELSYQYDIESEPGDLGHQMASWTGDD